jgi:hypothetical protein
MSNFNAPSIVEQPKNILRSDSQPILRQDQDVKVGQGTFVPQDNKNKRDLIIDPIVDVKSDINLRSKTRTKLQQDNIQLLDVAQKQDQKQDVMQIQSLKAMPKTTEKVKPLFIVKRFGDRQQPKGQGQFSVLVRKEGKFRLLGSGYSDLASAINRGKQEVKNTARASFKVVNTFGGVLKLNVSGDRTLRSSKREAGVVIQKNQFRISSPGEVSEISRKGQQSQRTRKSLKKKGIFG